MLEALRHSQNHTNRHDRSSPWLPESRRTSTPTTNCRTPRRQMSCRPMSLSTMVPCISSSVGELFAWDSVLCWQPPQSVLTMPKAPATNYYPTMKSRMNPFTVWYLCKDLSKASLKKVCSMCSNSQKSDHRPDMLKNRPRSTGSYITNYKIFCINNWKHWLGLTCMSSFQFRIIF